MSYKFVQLFDFSDLLNDDDCTEDNGNERTFLFILNVDVDKL